ncbi:MAG: dienelactone hydrolase family protein [Burkholderiales bacterium]|nr:MAG: dienelactone hydrolase family protein [Burkholderiales bacterium]
MGQTITLKAADGHSLGAYVAQPAGKPRGAIVVIQEIFGVNSHIRAVTDAFAADGYLEIAPAMFDRAKPGYETGYTPPDIEAGRTIMQGLDWDQAITDVAAAVAEASKSGKVGIVGYCWGGTVAWLAATRIDGLACAVPYYGGGIPNFADEQPRCPVMFHFGEADQSPTLEQAKAVAAKHPSAIAHYYPNAGHGFNCDQRPSYNAEASKTARERTLECLRQHVDAG